MHYEELKEKADAGMPVAVYSICASGRHKSCGIEIHIPVYHKNHEKYGEVALVTDNIYLKPGESVEEDINESEDCCITHVDPIEKGDIIRDYHRVLSCIKAMGITEEELRGSETKVNMKRLDEKTMVLSDGFVIKLNKKYRWSGVTEGLYTVTRWDDIFKVISIAAGSFTIYDEDDNKMYTITESFIKNSNLKFAKK